jgi:hypothetical protein
LQGWNKNVLDSCKNRFLYSSTLATYVHSLDNFRLEKLVSVHEVRSTTVAAIGRCLSAPRAAAHDHRLDVVPEQSQLVRDLRNRSVNSVPRRLSAEPPRALAGNW